MENAVWHTAIVCVSDDALKIASSILLRRHGYRAIETVNIDEAKAVLGNRVPALIVSGVLADPADELGAMAREFGIPYARIGPSTGFGALLVLLDKYHINLLNPPSA